MDGRPADQRRGALWVLVALGAVGGLTAIDVVLGERDIVIGTVVLGPLLCALVVRSRDVALVGALATLVALASGTWNDNFAAGSYSLRVLVVAVGSMVAFLAARRREQVEADRSRFRLLSAAADVGTVPAGLQDTAVKVTRLLVPAAADVCIVDVVSRGELRRLTAAVDGPDGERMQRALAVRRPSPLGAPSPSSAVASSAVQFVGEVDEEVLREAAHDDADLMLLRALALRSTIALPLVARGRVLGALTVAVTERSGRSYTEEDVAFWTVLAGRVALALDNAGLFTELETTEAQLSAAMAGLAEAVTVMQAEGGLVFANDAAARLLRFDSPQELLAAPVEDLIARFSPTHEDGTPVAPEDFPGPRLLAGLPAEPMLARNLIDGEERWTVTKASPVLGSHGRISLVVNVIEDVTEVKRAERTQRLLAEAGEVLASSLDFERTLQQVAELAVPALADWCSVSLPDGRGMIRTVAVAHRDPGRLRLAREITASHPTAQNAPTGVPQVLRERRSVVANDLTPEQLAAGAQGPEHARLLAELDVCGAMVVPLVGGGKAVGTLNFVSAESRRRFSDADLALAEELGRRAGTAVENARLYTERSRIARTLQAGLLPDELPEMPGWQARSLYRPADAEEQWVGGDFFDVIAVSGGWLALVGDVAGHGADAAALTALARHTLRATAKLLPDPLDSVARLNQELVERPDLSLCTVGAALLREHEGRTVAELICAGHPQALLLADGDARLVGHFGPMLGAYAAEGWERLRVDVPPGATLVLYTDGVLDTVGRDGRFGEARLQQALRGVDGAEAAVATIDAVLRAFQHGRQADDTAVLALQNTAVSAQGPATSGPVQAVTDGPTPLGERPWSLPAASAKIGEQRFRDTAEVTVGIEFSVDVPRDAAAAGVGRRFLRDRFGHAVDAQALADAQLIVSELLTNAVRHGEGAIRLRVSADEGSIRGEVVDEGHGFETELRERGEFDVGGRGLAIVAATAHRWGVYEGSSHVWFEIDRRRDDPHPTRPELGEDRRPDELD
jgi:serine phosphatase RsbU (regulator of sigma subunit)/PAS domain-containing protein/anti-sigma regulatory factor (Ser/Thr protein kinase)